MTPHNPANPHPAPPEAQRQRITPTPAKAAEDANTALLHYAMEQHGVTVLRLAIAHTGSRQDAEDVVQDVFLRLYAKTPRLTDDEHLKAWLIRTTINRCRDMTRAHSRRKTISLNDLPIDPTAFDDMQTRDEIRAAWEAVQKLPPDERAIVHLTCFEGLSYRETARIMNLSEGSVRSRLHKARTYLKEACGRTTEGDGAR